MSNTYLCIYDLTNTRGMAHLKIMFIYPKMYFIFRYSNVPVISRLNGWFRLKGKPCKTFDITVSTISGFFNFDFGRLQARSPLPTPTPAVTLLDSLLIYVLAFSCDKGAIKTCRSVSGLRLEPKCLANTWQKLHALEPDVQS